MSSGLLKLNLRDFGKGILVAVLGAVLSFVAAAVNAPEFTFAGFDWKKAVSIGVVAGVAYLIKNLGTDANGNILGLF